MLTALQEDLQKSLVAGGLNAGVAGALGKLASSAAATAIGAAAGGGINGAAGAFNEDLNNRQLHPDERKWARNNATKYQQYLKNKTGENITPKEAYQRLLSAGYAVTDDYAQKTGKSDETAKQFIVSNAASGLFKATYEERNSPLLGGNLDGSYTPMWTMRAPPKSPVTMTFLRWKRCRI
jgi:filamentous hemagglutinin